MDHFASFLSSAPTNGPISFIHASNSLNIYSMQATLLGMLGNTQSKTLTLALKELMLQWDSRKYYKMTRYLKRQSRYREGRKRNTGTREQSGYSWKLFQPPIGSIELGQHPAKSHLSLC